MCVFVCECVSFGHSLCVLNDTAGTVDPFCVRFARVFSCYEGLKQSVHMEI